VIRMVLNKVGYALVKKLILCPSVSATKSTRLHSKLQDSSAHSLLDSSRQTKVPLNCHSFLVGKTFSPTSAATFYAVDIAASKKLPF
jgi:hypothetical protein